MGPSTASGTISGCRAPGDTEGPFVVQCKHTKQAGGTLSESALEDEFGKVQALVDAACAAATC